MKDSNQNNPNNSGGAADFVPLSSLGSADGRGRYWRSLDELAGTEQFRRSLGRACR